MGLLSGDSEETGILLLVIMGVLIGIFALGLVVDLFLRKSGKRLCKPVSRKYITTTSISKVDTTIMYPENLVLGAMNLSNANVSRSYM